VNLLKLSTQTHAREVFHLSRDGAFHSANSISLDSRENDRARFSFFLLKAAAHAKRGANRRARREKNFFAEKSERKKERDSLNRDRIL
jgi:hypothetical protein